MGGDVRDQRHPLAHAAAFVIGEEERAIAAQRTARRSAELVALVGRARLPGGGEEIACVHRAVAQELVGCAVELVAAASEHHVELPAAVAPERGIVAAGGHLELAHGVHRRRHGDAVELGVAVENTVELEIVGVLPGAVDVDREIAAHRPGRSLSGRHDAG